MSQVVVTSDSLKSRRLKSGEKERDIDREGQFSKWRSSDISKFDPIAAAVGVAVLPIVAIWFVLGCFVQLAIYLSIFVSRMVGALLPKS